MSEAARVDGASTWDLFWRIHVPLARAPIASLGILMSVWTWNQFLLALVLVEDPTQRTMAGALGAFQGHYATDIPLLCAGTILILLPTLHPLHPLPAPGHRRAAPGFSEGMTAAPRRPPATDEPRCARLAIEQPTGVAPRPQLLTYPDSLGGNLRALGQLLDGPLAGLFHGRAHPAALPFVRRSRASRH